MNTRVTLERRNPRTGGYELVASYGQAAEFWNAFPNMLGGIDLKSYTRNDTLTHSLITIERYSLGKDQYRLTGNLK